jgi:hypothetical protein
VEPLRFAEEEGAPRRAAPPLAREDAIVYARTCLPAEIGDGELPEWAGFVRSVLADIRDLP